MQAKLNGQLISLSQFLHPDQSFFDLSRRSLSPAFWSWDVLAQNSLG